MPKIAFYCIFILYFSKPSGCPSTHGTPDCGTGSLILTKELGNFGDSKYFRFNQLLITVINFSNSKRGGMATHAGVALELGIKMSSDHY